jgi:hypothetical protein
MEGLIAFKAQLPFHSYFTRFLKSPKFGQTKTFNSTPKGFTFQGDIL